MRCSIAFKLMEYNSFIKLIAETIGGIVQRSEITYFAPKTTMGPAPLDRSGGRI